MAELLFTKLLIYLSDAEKYGRFWKYCAAIRFS